MSHPDIQIPDARQGNPGPDAMEGSVLGTAPARGSVHTTLAQAAGRLSPERLFDVIFDHGDAITVELYIPRKVDLQKPHDRHELYIVATGSGTFVCGDERVRFTAGDLLHAPAHVSHRFDSFTEDFTVWVIFYGPRVPPPRP